MKELIPSRALLGVSWALLGSLGALSGSSWTPFGLRWDLPSWALLGLCCYPFRVIWCSSVGLLGTLSFRVPLGFSLGPLLASLAYLSGHLGLSWDCLGAFVGSLWDSLRAFLGSLGLYLAHFLPVGRFIPLL